MKDARTIIRGLAAGVLVALAAVSVMPAPASQAAVAVAAARPGTPPSTAAAPAEIPERHPEQDEAERLLREQVRLHPALEGTTVEFGDARGHQAISMYTLGRIIIDEHHGVPLERIIEHEVWHVIDWRDNGRIDWGEDVPRG